MSSKVTGQGSEPGPSIANFTARIHEIEPLLELSGTWQLNEYADGNQRLNSLVVELRRDGHVKRVDRVEERGSLINVYRWAEQSKAKFEAYVEQLNRLPCNCRAHIPPEAGNGSDEWPCKHCGEIHARTVYENQL